MREDEAHQQYLPWHFRDRLTPTRTYSGRVVYERPKHFFGLSDVDRILRAINPKQVKSTGFERIFRALWDLIFMILPYPKDLHKPILEIILHMLTDIGTSIIDPIGTSRARLIELIYAIAEVLNIKVIIS